MIKFIFSTKSLNKTMAYKVWADQDLNLFRENIKNWHIPNKNVITYNGVFGDYHFNLPNWKCEKMFCPLANLTTWTNLKWKQGYYVHIGLWSNIKKDSFKRKKTNFVLVIDKSGSMDENLNSYYYKNKNPKCEAGLVYFKEWNKCVNQKKLAIYEDKVKEYNNKTKMDLVKQATIEMLNKMNPEDRISVIMFDNNGYIAHPLVKLKNINKEKFKQHVNKINADNGTNMESWLNKVKEVLNDDNLNNWYQTRIIFITDAMPNIGNSSPTWLSKIVEELSNKGYYFTFLWVGIDFQQAFIQKLAKYKWSNYFFINNSYDIYKRLVDEFDYNFFPMIFNLSFKINNSKIVDKVYGLDNDIKKDGELFHINTLFPTPPTADGYRGSIVLLKLKNKPEKELKFQVSYENQDGEKENVETIVNDNVENDLSAKKWIVLVNYVNTVKQAILDQDSEILKKLWKYLKENKKDFEADDSKIFAKEIETTKKLKELLKNGVKQEKDYWQKK